MGNTRSDFWGMGEKEVNANDILFSELDKEVDNILTEMVKKYGPKLQIRHWLYFGNQVRDKIFILILSQIPNLSVNENDTNEKFRGSIYV